MEALDPDIWRRLLRRCPDDAHLSPLYGPVIAPPTSPDGCFVLGRIAQSLDGRIATVSGQSQWITGREDIEHTHRLRALSDAVVIGAATVRADDPQLTTRHVEGPSPVRVVLDTDRRLDHGYRVFRDGPETLLLCAADAPGPETHGHARTIRLPRSGRGVTVSRFLAAGALDRLHVIVAPLLLGSGIPAFTLPDTAALADGMRLHWSMHRAGCDLLLDIPLDRARPASCR